MTTRKATTTPMEIKLVVRRQYVVTLDEEEAQNIRCYLEGLQESDYEIPFKRNHVTDPEQQANTIREMGHFREALRQVPAAHSNSDTRRL